MSAPPTDTPTRLMRPEWDGPTDGVVGPPESTFWQRYNQHLEFPTSLLISVLALSLGFMMIVFVVWAAMRAPDTKPVPIVLGEGGTDDAGDGKPGEGPNENPIAHGDYKQPTQDDFKNLNLPTDQLPKVKDEIKSVLDIDDPSSSVSVSDATAAAINTLDKELRDKLLGIGQRKGKQGPGTGSDGPGDGIGGTGNDSTRARSLRWVLRFRVASGRDYLNQLMSMKAVVMVPVKDSNKQMYIFRDLANPKPGTVATDADIAQLSRQIQFSDIRREQVQSVAEALGLDYGPPVFWAFFPPELEAELSRKEKAFRNRQPENIEETIFQVVVRGGQYEIAVVDQRAKR